MTADASVVVIGLDGASPRLVDGWAQRGVLPTLARLIERGASGALRSTVPPVTAPAWVSFMTGRNPGKHGVFNFRAMDLSRYAGVGPGSVLASSASFQGETVFEIVGDAGGRVASINVPVTYPPFAVNGVLVAGLPLLPDMRRAYTHPPELADAIGAWSLDNETLDRLPDRRRLAAADFWLKKHLDVSLDLLRSERWQLFATVIRNTDVIPHYFWRRADPLEAATNGRSSAGAEIEEHYRKSDEAVGRLIEAAPEGALIIVMSDHGMDAYPTRRVQLNAWLASLGLLGGRADRVTAVIARPALRAAKRLLPRRYRLLLRRYVPQQAQESAFRTLDHADRIDWPRTKAYRVPLFPMVEGIEINLRGRQPQGVVSPGQEYEELRRSIVAGLRELTDPDTGERLVAEAGLREEVYSGPFVDLAPDIVCLFNEGYTGGPEHAGPLVAAARANAHRWEATHRMDGVFIAAGPMVRPNARIAGANIVDVAPTVLYALGLPVPEDMDGRVLTEIFEPSFVEARPVLRGRPARRPRSRDALSPEETEQIMGQLRGLGYL